MKEAHKKRSKSLSFWLRHAPEKGNIRLNPSGWAPVDEVLIALFRKGLKTDLDLLRSIVAENDKQRFELSGDETKIRARQGHSIAVEGAWQKADPPSKLYHGTVGRFLGSILSEGLTKQNRHHVHLSADIETAQKVGSRRGTAVILEIDAARMAANGEVFSLSSNGVWLVDAVAPDYITQLQS